MTADFATGGYTGSTEGAGRRIVDYGGCYIPKAAVDAAGGLDALRRLYGLSQQAKIIDSETGEELS